MSAGWFVHRVLLIGYTLLVVSLVVFAITEILPADAAAVILGQSATPAALAAVRARLGLNDPAWLQYWHWLWPALHGHFGISMRTNQPVGATPLGTLSGSVIGTASAYLGGRADEAIMRTIDAVLAIPALLILSTLGRGAADATLAIAIAFAPGMARITRSVALAARQQDYVNAAIARGEGGGWIVFREMAPNVIAPAVVESTIRVAFAVMLVASLPFLGLGAQPPAPEWGLMIAEGREYLHPAPWMIVAPGAAIALTDTGFNLLGDGLRDALNPRIGR